MEFSKKDIEALILSQIEGYNTDAVSMFVAVGRKHALGSVQAGFLLLVRDKNGFTVDGTVIGASGANDYDEVLRNRSPIFVPHSAVQNSNVGDYPNSPNITGQLMSNIMLVHSALRAAYEAAMPYIDNAIHNAERDNAQKNARQKAAKLIASMNLPAPVTVTEKLDAKPGAINLNEQVVSKNHGKFFQGKNAVYDFEGAMVQLGMRRDYENGLLKLMVNIPSAPDAHPLSKVVNIGADRSATYIPFSSLVSKEGVVYEGDTARENDRRVIYDYLRNFGLQNGHISFNEPTDTVAVDSELKGDVLPNVVEVVADSGQEPGATSPPSLVIAEVQTVKPVKTSRRRDAAKPDPKLAALVTDVSVGTGRHHPSSKRGRVTDNHAHVQQ